MADNSNTIVMEDVTDPAEWAKARAQRERFDRNAAWLQAHAHEVYSKNRAEYFCIAGEELFVANSAEEAVALAQAAHAEDDGWFFRHIPKENVPQIYERLGPRHHSPVCRHGRSIPKCRLPLVATPSLPN
jgi:23S rRNA A1618 N6-methylase RlmF